MFPDIPGAYQWEQGATGKLVDVLKPDVRARESESLCVRHFQGQSEGCPAFTTMDQDADVSRTLPKQNARRSRGAKPFAAVDQTGFGRIDKFCSRIDVEQRNGDGARQMSLQPLGPAANIHKLHRGIVFQRLPDVYLCVAADIVMESITQVTAK